jgi:hypothetical protein
VKFAPGLELKLPEIKATSSSPLEVGKNRNSDTVYVFFNSIAIAEFREVNGKVDSMTSVYQPAFIAYVMQKVLKQNDYNNLIGRSKGTALDLSAVKPEDLREVERMIGAQTDDANAIDQANKSNPHYADLPLNPRNTRGVLQGEGAITGAKSAHFQLATFAAATCVILAAWNPDTKIAGLAHVDVLTDLGSVRRLLYGVASGGGAHKTQVHLAGGEGSSKELQVALIKIIKQDPVTMELESADLGISGSDSLAISAENGKIATGVSRSQVDLGADVDRRLKLVEVRLKLAGMKMPPTPLTMVPET